MRTGRGTLATGLDAAGFLEAEIPDAMDNLQKVFDQLDSNGDILIHSSKVAHNRRATATSNARETSSDIVEEQLGQLRLLL